MKFVVDLPEDTPLKPGTVLHTLGFPEPEIFGFLYVHPDHVASVGIFVPSWFESPVRTTYRYLQHYVQHPYLWRWLKDARLRSWGAKSILESGRRGEPVLAGDGFARIGEGSGSTNVLTSSGVDEAFTTGVQLAEGVIELLEAGKPFTRENLDAAYVARRRASWVERRGGSPRRRATASSAASSRASSGWRSPVSPAARSSLGEEPPHPAEKIGTSKGSTRARSPPRRSPAIRQGVRGEGRPAARRAHGPRGLAGAVPLDGKLLVTHQDALLMGGKVQAPARLRRSRRLPPPGALPGLRAAGLLRDLLGRGAPAGRRRRPSFDREKCVHCGACLWSCTRSAGRTR